MEVKTVGKEQGRDASVLFRGQKKTKWNDVSFIRSTSGGKPWLCAVTNDLKLVFSGMDDPWLYDLAKDPDEMDNRIGREEYAVAVKRLTKALATYCKKYQDPYGDDAKIKAAMKAIMAN